MTWDLSSAHVEDTLGHIRTLRHFCCWNLSQLKVWHLSEYCTTSWNWHSPCQLKMISQIKFAVVYCPAFAGWYSLSAPTEGPDGVRKANSVAPKTLLWKDKSQSYQRQTSKISKPAISSTPMKYWRLFFVSRVLLTRATNHVNIRPYRALARAATEYTTWTYANESIHPFIHSFIRTREYLCFLNTFYMQT